MSRRDMLNPVFANSLQSTLQLVSCKEHKVWPDEAVARGIICFRVFNVA